MKNRRFRDAASVLVLAASVVVLALSPPSYAQAGSPIIRTNSGTTNMPDPIFIDAYEATGGSSGLSDICSRINTAWTNAVSTTLPSVTIDARGFTYANGTGTSNGWVCASSPFPSTSNAAGGRLLLGNVLILTSVTWQIPSRVTVEGMGVGGLTTAVNANTTIRATSTSADPVIQIGNSGGAVFAAKLLNLTVNAYALATTGVSNVSGEEGTSVEDVNIWDATSTGLLIEGGNSGPYRNINIQYDDTCSSCTPAAGISLAGATFFPKSSGVRGIDNVTVSGSGVSIAYCIQDVGIPVQITNSHLEFCGTGIQIGSQAVNAPTTYNVEVQNVSIYPGGNNSWNISMVAAADILLSGINAYFTEVLQDNVTGNTITGTAGGKNYLGFYLLGDTTGGATPAVISTTAVSSTGSHAPNLEWVAPGGLDVLQALQKPSGTFKIDDPLDPRNKYLYHSFVESPDMMDIYNGTVTTDKRGFAVVALPKYFEALNRDFRYQLTPIGSLAQATVAKEIVDNHFTVRTSNPGVKVSWQVTGIRHDAYADAHRVQVEEEKPEKERGRYLHPDTLDRPSIGASVGGQPPR